jgi:hypothetical protein
MNPVIRNVFAVIGGVALGMLVNMLIITISGSVIPPPEGIDPTDSESMINNIHLLQPKHFIFPFLAHALGTLAGAFIAAKFSATKPLISALIAGAFFLLGGIAASMMIPAPSWFMALDLIMAYLPMAFLGAKLVGEKSDI